MLHRDALIRNQLEKPVGIGKSVPEEGIPLVSFLEDGLEKVGPCNGDENEVFAGVSFMHNQLPTDIPWVQEYLVPVEAPYVVDLGKTNIVNGQASAKNLTNDSWMLPTGSASEGTAFVMDYAKGKATFAAGDAGRLVRFHFRFQPTVAELRQRFAPAELNTWPVFADLNSVGCISSGRFYTDRFDITVNWEERQNSVYLAAGGVFGGPNAPTPTNTLVDRMTVIATPTNELPFLGLEYNL